MFGTRLILGLIYFVILGPGWTTKMVPKPKPKSVAAAAALLAAKVTAAEVTLDEWSLQMD